ncbi:MAG: acetoacetate--CoA ligase [Xanthomonadales bacterium]|nr:acetoacetate--CoA ligase [Xanthomonadales bacterium]
MSDQPMWSPSPQRVEDSNMSRFIRFVGRQLDETVDDYASLYEFSIRKPAAFWEAVWEFCGIRASSSWDQVVDDPARMPGARWFSGSRLNFAQNLLRHRDERTAIIFCGEDGTRRELTALELRDATARMAAALRSAGVGPGDRVAGFLPNLPETIIAMLATTSLGAIWSSCSPDFGINGVVDRFGQIEPKVLFCADGYHYGGKTFGSLDRVRGIAEKIDSIEHIVVVPYADPDPDLSGIARATLWDDFADQSASGANMTFEQLPFDHPVYIMYSSGTTGVPKCIVHGAGGTLLQHLKELVLHTDLKREDRIFYFTTCGWMMWNWLVSSLAVGSTVVLFDGNPFHPGPDALFELANEEGVTVFGTSAKYLSAVEKAGVKPRQTHPLKSLRTILSTGSPLLPESFDFVYRDVKERLCLSSISGGTDIISCFALGNPILPVYRGELQCRGLGMKVEILDADDQPVRDQPGELACSLAFPSMPVSFWNDPDGSKYHDAYFSRKPGVWCHGDYAKLTRHDGLIIYGRSDAVLNPGGVRIGTAEIYRQVEKLPEVLESIAVGQEWEDDVRVVLFIRLRDDAELNDELQARIRQVLKDNASPRHVPARILTVPDIPRTISGKITELAVRDVIHGRPVKNTDALANPEALKHFKDRPELQS